MKEIKAWACDYCSFQNYYMSVVIDHEISCDFNPRNKTCETCGHCKEVHPDLPQSEIDEALKYIPNPSEVGINAPQWEKPDWYQVVYCRQQELPAKSVLNEAWKIKRNCMYWIPDE